MERRLAAIMAADVVGYSRLVGADEADTPSAPRTANRRFRAHGRYLSRQSRQEYGGWVAGGNCVRRRRRDLRHRGPGRVGGATRAACPMPHIAPRGFAALSAGKRRADRGGCEKCGLGKISNPSSKATRVEAS